MLFEWIVGILAAVGLICILRSGYDILCAGCPRAGEHAELYLYLDGREPGAEQLLRAAHRARAVFLPGMPIVWIDTGAGCGPLRRLAERLDMEYFGFDGGMNNDDAGNSGL